MNWSTLLFPVALLAATQGRNELQSLVEAERAFAARSAHDGMDKAFLSFLDSSAVIFRPNPVKGPTWIREHPSPPMTLSWEPDFAAVSFSGDLGYTSGPWKAERPAETSRPPRYGSFVSVWRKFPSKGWKVICDIGITHARREADPVAALSGSSYPIATGGGDASVREILNADSLLTALAPVLSTSARVYRDGHVPAVSADSCAALLRNDGGTTRWAPLAAYAASSGDLGWSYGRVLRGGDAKDEGGGYYLRIWRREGERGEWRVVLDLE